MWRIAARVGVFTLVLIVVIVTAAGGAFYAFSRQPFPQTQGELRLPGLSAPVTVIRDKFGVPHIYADTPADLFRAQGFVQAQDRYFQLEFQRRIGKGRLAELFGKSALEQDKFIRTLGWARIAAEEERLLTPETRAVLEAYAAGVNAYALANPDRLGFEFRVLGLIGRQWQPEPWTAVDSLTWGKAMAWSLGGNMDAELLRAAILARGGQELVDAVIPPYPADAPVTVPSGAIGELQPDAAAGSQTDNAAALLALHQLSQQVSRGLGMERNSEIGSNNWVISGERTVTGMPILADDPHLGLAMPSIWYQVGLHCRQVNDACPYDVAGVSFPGTPGVIIGHNARIAWGVTNTGPDVQDLFIERANPNNADEFEYKGQFEQADVREEKITVAGEAEPVILRVRVTRHGPILNDVMTSLKDKEPLALRWTASQPGTLFRSVIELNKAQNWEQFREALRYWDVPSQNFVYADVDGNIGYQVPGNIPIRAKGDGSVPVLGYSGEYEWTGAVPYEALPYAFNPPQGYIATANNAPTDSAYAHFLGRDWDYGYRIRRINQMMEATPKLSVDDVKRMQMDAHSAFAADVMPYVSALPAPQEPLAAAALDAMQRWDQRNTRDSVGALIFETFWIRLAHRVFDAPLGEELSKSALGPGTHTKTAVRNLLRDEASHFWRDAAQDAANPRDEVMLLALRDAVTVLTTRFGADIAQWQWGKAHHITFANQTLGKSGIALVEGIFNRGPFAVDGAPAAVNNTGSGSETMVVTSGPSWRMIVDMSDFSQSLAIHTTGQSGHAYHPHNDDMIRKWIEGEYNPLLFSRADVERYAEATLTLLP